MDSSQFGLGNKWRGLKESEIESVGKPDLEQLREKNGWCLRKGKHTESMEQKGTGLLKLLDAHQAGLIYCGIIPPGIIKEFFNEMKEMKPVSLSTHQHHSLSILMIRQSKTMHIFTTYLQNMERYLDSTNLCRCQNSSFLITEKYKKLLGFPLS